MSSTGTGSVRVQYQEALLSRLGRRLRAGRNRGEWAWSLGLLPHQAFSGVLKGSGQGGVSSGSGVWERSLVSMGNECASLRVWESATVVTEIESQVAVHATAMQLRRWAEGGGGGLGGGGGGGLPEGSGGVGPMDGSYVGQVAAATLKLIEFVSETMCRRSSTGSVCGEGGASRGVQRNLTSRACSILGGLVARVAQETNMYPRNRSLRAL